MKNKHHLPLPLRLLIFVILHSSFSILHSQVPNLVSYQGRVAVGTVNFEGTGQFRFALVNATGSTVYWGNAADTTPADGVPDAAVSLAVSKGLYSVLLGDTSLTNMAAIPASVWANADVRLRVWFNDGVNGNQLLTPDQRLAPNGYLPDGSVSSAALANSSVTAAKMAAGSVTSVKLASGLTLGGTTSGAFNGNLTGNATTATSATTFTGALAGDVTGTQSATTIGAATVTGKALTGFSSTTGTITASDTILSAINKLNGNVALKAPIASPTFSGTVTGTFIGNGSALTNLNGGNLTAGTVTSAKLAADVGLWSTSGANVFRTAGNIGIGTNAPITALDIVAPFGSVAGVRLGGASLTASRFIGIGETNGIGGPSDSFSGVEFGGPSGPSGGFVAFHTHHSGVAVAERMRIDLDGNVGIGTTTPEQKLHVAGTVQATAFIGTVTVPANGLVIGTNQLVTYGGNVGIGTNAPDAALHVVSQTAGSGNNTAAFSAPNIGVHQSHIHYGTTGNWIIRSASSAGKVVIQDTGGNVGIGTTSPATKLDVAGEITCVAINLTSDRNAKEQFKPVNAREVLDKVIGMPITEWQYKARDGTSADSVRHIGPMAQDFRAAFALGHDERHITSVDADGVALAAIQGLNAKLEAEVRAKDALLSRLERENQRLAERMAVIEARLQAGAPLSKE